MARRKNNVLKMAMVMAIFSSVPSVVNAHGWSEFPSARQNTCYEQGGVWSGTPSNAACAQAKDISGSYPFVQRNEYAINIQDFNNINAVKAAIPDGTLCYANDAQKRGMGAPHTAWIRTEVSAGVFEFVFNATAPHNPSFWEFYLTKPNADLSKGLAWGDLDLIQKQGNVPINDGKYHINVTIPPDRSGDAILFVRWQRDDAAGEGFYNCSDITILAGETLPPETKPPETKPPEANLVRGDLFVANGFGTPTVGDTVTYDIIDKHGQIAHGFNIKIDATNVNDWARLLASKINGWHEEFKDGTIFIGDWHAEMQHYMYFQHDPSRNFFNSKDSQASGLLTLIEGEYGGDELLNGDIYELVKSDNVVNAGDKVVITTDEAATLVQTQGTAVSIENNGTSSIMIDTKAITVDETLLFVASAINSERVETFTFDVIVAEVAPDPDTGTWDSMREYQTGDIVTYSDEQWKAQWWVQGGEPPKATYLKDKWGVWRPVN